MTITLNGSDLTVTQVVAAARHGAPVAPAPARRQRQLERQHQLSKIDAIRLDRMRLLLHPPFYAAWDPVPRREFDATLVTVHTDEGVIGHGSGDTMDGFEPFEPLSTGRDPLADRRSRADASSRSASTPAAAGLAGGRAVGHHRPGHRADRSSVLFGGATRRLPAYASFRPGP